MTSIRFRRPSRFLRNVILVGACAAAGASGLALAAKPSGGGGGGGGGGGKTATWTVRLQGIGDSIMQGYNATCTGNTSFLDLFCYSGGEQPENSFFDGTSSAVYSLADRFLVAGASTTYSKAASQSGSEMVGGSNNFKVQAQAVVGASRKPMQVKVELGGNDICNRTSVATMYTDEQWRAGVRAGLDVLTQKLPDGSSVVLVGVPRVQDLRAVGLAKSSSRVDCPSFWDSYDVCNIATLDQVMGGQTLTERLPVIGQRQARYNAILVEEAAAYNALAASTRVEVIAETDGSPLEVGTYSFQPSEINGGDCFHPSIEGQNKVSAVVWANDRFTTKP